MENILEDKSVLRGKIKLLNKTLITENLAEKASESLLKKLQPVVDKACSITIYHASRNELSMSRIIEYGLKNNKLIYQPIAYKESKILKFERIYDIISAPIFFDNLYKLRNEESIEKIDLICIPLLAVDNDGYRLGKGGGYYDSTLEKIYKEVNRKSIVCGIGYEWQMVDKVPRNKWDLKLDIFCSEERLYEFKK